MSPTPTHQQIYVNVGVKDLPRSRAFFEGLGYRFNADFSNEQGACLVLNDDIYVMLLTEPFLQGFTKKPVADTSKSTEVLICLSCDSRQQVDELVARAVALGATTPNAKQDYGFMYSHGYEDLDGHLWELVYMSPNATPTDHP